MVSKLVVGFSVAMATKIALSPQAALAESCTILAPDGTRCISQKRIIEKNGSGYAEIHFANACNRGITVNAGRRDGSVSGSTIPAGGSDEIICYKKVCGGFTGEWWEVYCWQAEGIQLAPGAPGQGAKEPVPPSKEPINCNLLKTFAEREQCRADEAEAK